MDKFQRLEKLGKGSFGDVWLAERKEDKKVRLYCLSLMAERLFEFLMKLFALKRVPLSNEEIPLKNTANDILLAGLEHPNIIRCYDTFIENKKLYIIMEYADNGN